MRGEGVTLTMCDTGIASALFGGKLKSTRDQERPMPSRSDAEVQAAEKKQKAAAAGSRSRRTVLTKMVATSPEEGAATDGRTVLGG